MHLVDALDGFPQAVRCPEGVSYMNAPDDQDLVFDNNITTNFGREIPPADRDLTRFQRAGKSADQSATGCGDDIIEGGGMWHLDINALAPVVLSDRTVGAKMHRLRLCGQISEPIKLFLATLNMHAGNVGGCLFVHRQPFCQGLSCWPGHCSHYYYDTTPCRTREAQARIYGPGGDFLTPRSCGHSNLRLKTHQRGGPGKASAKCDQPDQRALFESTAAAQFVKGDGD
jgi:hypothetical protein